MYYSVHLNFIDNEKPVSSAMEYRSGPTHNHQNADEAEKRLEQGLGTENNRVEHLLFDI
jgi:hypothetical protein